jgi:hypothetical protein
MPRFIEEDKTELKRGRGGGLARSSGREYIVV